MAGDSIKDIIKQVSAQAEADAAKDKPATADEAAAEKQEAAVKADEAAGNAEDGAGSEEQSAADDSDEGADEGAQEDQRDAKPKKNALVRRIDKLTSQKADLAAENAALKQQLAALRSGAQAESDADDDEGDEQPTPDRRKPKTAAPAKTEAEIRAEIAADMRREAEANAFNTRSNEAFDAGVKAYGKEEFQEAVDTIKAVGLDRDVLEDILATDAPSKVLFLLGSDADEAERIIGLPQRKRIAELVKLSTSRARGGGTQGKTSAVPDPIRPVGGRGEDAPTTQAAVQKQIDGFFERRRVRLGG